MLEGVECWWILGSTSDGRAILCAGIRICGRAGIDDE
jgi:hypothetical protein